MNVIQQRMEKKNPPLNLLSKNWRKNPPFNFNSLW